MHVTGHIRLPVEITGPSRIIEALAGHDAMRDARLYALHGHAWLELADVTPSQLELALEHGCEVHGSSEIAPCTSAASPRSKLS